MNGAAFQKTMINFDDLSIQFKITLLTIETTKDDSTLMKSVIII